MDMKKLEGFTVIQNKILGIWILVVCLIVVSGCATMQDFTYPSSYGRQDYGGDDIGAGLEVQKIDVPGKRGVVIDFQQGLPLLDGREISAKGSHVVGVNIENNMDENIFSSLKIYDSSDLCCFTNVDDMPIHLLPGNYDSRNKYVPYRIRHDTSSFGYEGAHDASTTTFFIKIRYDKVSDFKFDFCYADVNPGAKRAENCDVSETISGIDFGTWGEDYLRDPVVVSSIKKTLSVGEREKVKLIFDIVISNEGGGTVKDFVDFRFSTELDGKFSCESDYIAEKVLGDESSIVSMKLKMENERDNDVKSMDVRCKTNIDRNDISDTLNKKGAEISLTYEYEYMKDTGVVDINP